MEAPMSYGFPSRSPSPFGYNTLKSSNPSSAVPRSGTNVIPHIDFATQKVKQFRYSFSVRPMSGPESEPWANELSNFELAESSAPESELSFGSFFEWTDPPSETEYRARQIACSPPPLSQTPRLRNARDGPAPDEVEAVNSLISRHQKEYKVLRENTLVLEQVVAQQSQERAKLLARRMQYQASLVSPIEQLEIIPPGGHPHTCTSTTRKRPESDLALARFHYDFTVEESPKQKPQDVGDNINWDRAWSRSIVFAGPDVDILSPSAEVNVDHLLETSRLPSELEAESIRDVIASLETQISAITTDIHVLKHIIGCTANRKTAVENFITSHSMLLSAFRRLGNETLKMIFFLCIPFDGLLCAPNATLVILGLVCKSWRSVTLATPLFWSSIRLRIDYTYPPRRTLRVMTTWLKRSGDRPLSLSFCQGPLVKREGPYPLSPDFRPLSKILTDYAKRWHRLEFSSFHGHFIDLVIKNLHNRSPCLAHLRFLEEEHGPPPGSGSNWPSRAPHPLPVWDLPRLESLELRLTLFDLHTLRTRFQFGISSLLHLTLVHPNETGRLTASEFMQILSLTLRLVTFTLEYTDPDPLHPPAPIHPLKLRDLEKLAITTEYPELVLDRLELPMLSEIRCSAYAGRWNGSPITAISSLLTRSSLEFKESQGPLPLGLSLVFTVKRSQENPWPIPELRLNDELLVLDSRKSTVTKADMGPDVVIEYL